MLWSKERREVDWWSEYFQVIAAKGERIQVCAGYFESDDAEPTWHQASHSEYDGLGGMAALLDHLGIPRSALSHTKRVRKPGFFESIGLIRRYLRASRPRQVNWKHFDRSQSGDSDSVAWFMASREETERIFELARTAQASLPSLLLSRLSQQVATQLQNGESDSQIWLFPVSLRGRLKDASQVNQASFVGVEVGSQDGPLDVSRNIRKLLSQQAHWGPWLGVQLIGRLFGAKAFSRAYDRYDAQQHCWSGTFSYLGRWPCQGEAQTGSSDDMLIPITLVAKFLPVGGSAIVWRNRLALAIKLHPGLSTDVDDAQRLVDGWAASVLEEGVEVDRVALRTDQSISNRLLPPTANL